MFRCLLFFLCLFAFNNKNVAQQSGYKYSIDSFLHYLQNENSFFGTVEMKKGTELIYSYRSKSLTTNHNQYKIGSITKVFTALVTFQLIEENKLTLQTSLNNFFPKIKNSEQITIENLLSHTSGIFNITSWENYYSTRNQIFSKEQTLDIIYQSKPEFKPNKDCSYSNSNYVLLGYIIESITGKSYSTNIKERILDKIGLKNTFVAENEQDIKDIKSYLFDGKDWFEDVSSHPSLPYSAGAMVSTVSDLNQLMYHIFHGNIVTDSSLAKMQQLKSKSIGHGLFKAPFHDKVGWGHTGRIDEFKSAALYFPDQDLYLSITSNGSRVSINDIMIGILSGYFNKKINYPVFYHSDIQEPQTTTFVGNYKAKLLGLFTVGRFNLTEGKNNHLLMGEINNGKIGEKTILERIDANSFYSRLANGKLIFIVKKNKVKKMFLQQGKMSIKCVKTK